MLFSGKIKCLKCGKKHKAKKQRGVYVYVCSTYDNYGECKRNAMREDFIVDLVMHRYDDQIDKLDVKNKVDRIEILNKNVFTIELFGDIPIVFEENYIEF